MYQSEVYGHWYAITLLSTSKSLWIYIGFGTKWQYSFFTSVVDIQCNLLHVLKRALKLQNSFFYRKFERLCSFDRHLLPGWWIQKSRHPWRENVPLCLFIFASRVACPFGAPWLERAWSNSLSQRSLFHLCHEIQIMVCLGNHFRDKLHWRRLFHLQASNISLYVFGILLELRSLVLRTIIGCNGLEFDSTKQELCTVAIFQSERTFMEK